MLNINGETYHVLGFVPAAHGMYAQIDDKTYELVVLWGHFQRIGIDGNPVDEVFGVTIVDLEHRTFTVHDEYTTNPPRIDGVTLKR